MLRQLLPFFFVLSTGLLVAQTPASSPAPSSPEPCTIAFYTRDSIAIQFADAKPKYEAIRTSELKLNTIREQQIPAMDELLTAQRDSAKNQTAEGKKAIQDARKKVDQLKADSMATENHIRSLYVSLQPTYKKVDAVADSIGKAQGVKQTREAGDNSAMICPTDQVLMRDITNDVAIVMNVKPKLARVGIYNRDSLLRTMPGYAVRADSSLIDLRRLDSAVAIMDQEIKAKQRELDSLRPSLGKIKLAKKEKELADLQDNRDAYYYWEKYSIELRQADRTKAYTDKLDAALAASVKETGCRYYYSQMLDIPWTEKEAEFVDLNERIAQKIKAAPGK